MEREKLGKRIRAVRKQNGLSVDALTELTGLTSDSYIRMIESGAKTPSLKTFVAVCNALNVSPDYLLADSLGTHNESGIETQAIEKIKLLAPADVELINVLAAKLISQTENGLR